MHPELARLADHLGQRREEILRAWRTAVRRDPALTTSHALPRSQLNDHVPGVLAAFEDALRAPPAPVTQLAPSAEASAHGVHRWQQGYDLHEVTRELGTLNRCMVTELDAYAETRPEVPHDVMAHARQIWAASTSTDLEESTSQYFRLQRVEAAGHVNSNRTGPNWGARSRTICAAPAASARPRRAAWRWAPRPTRRATSSSASWAIT